VASPTWSPVGGHEPDAGIWEIRGDASHHVHSKMMGWLALDRALRIAETHRLPARQRRRWLAAREAIAADVRERGFDPMTNRYTRSYGSDDVDAALLVLPLLGIEESGSPRVRDTVDAIRHELSAGGPLLSAGARRPARRRGGLPAVLLLQASLALRVTDPRNKVPRQPVSVARGTYAVGLRPTRRGSPTG